uniref:ACB domain-containing protein n=1 Tax=Oryza glumipatula TaxID=40148 RepID=A0A0D9ZFF6_9ORYZ
MASSGLAYPDRFYAAAAYAGFGAGGATSSSAISRFQNDVALLLYGLYQQATVGPCNVPKPRAWNPVEQSKWTSWHGLGSMPSAEAMRLFVKILEEEDPGWYSRVPEFNPEPVVDIEMHKPKEDPKVILASTNGTSIPEPKTISENGSSVETQDKVVILEGLSAVSVHEEWTPLSVNGQRPKPRYEHGATVVQDKMYIFGGNHNGRYLSDLQALDLKSLTWSKIDAKFQAGSTDSSKSAQVSSCAGHSLISWGNKFFSVAGHTKDPSENITVKEFDPHTCTWSIVKTYGKPPVSRGGQSVTLVGTTLVLFGGEDAKRCLLNDLHILDLETMTWDDVDAIGTPPPRSDHAAACHADRYLLIFGGGSHATCFNDLHVLDLQTMEWSRPKQQGLAPSPRAGHAGATVGENWYIVGGGNNKSGVSETLVLNMSTLTWSVVSSVEGRVPLASEGMTLVHSNYNGDDYLISFGGYNGRYSNEVFALKLTLKSDLQSKTKEHASDGTSSVLEPEVELSHDGKIREIAMDSADSDLKKDDANELLVALKAEKEELEAALNREQVQTIQLKEEIAEAEARNAELTKELQTVRGQLAAEQSRCFKLEVDVAELRQKLQSMDALEREVELLRRQKAASEQAALEAKQRQSSSGMWGWLVGTPPDKSES